MTRLVWGNSADRRYYDGISKGVLYPLVGSPVPWNGLTSVVQTNLGKDVEPLVYDGVKYFDMVDSSDFQAKITAISMPAALETCMGNVIVQPGFIITRQAKMKFGLSYRTEIGEYGYKIHLVYNATASITKRTYATLSDNTTIADLELTVDTVPEPSGIFKPSAHFIVDSTKTPTDKMVTFENYIYGDPSTPPVFPTIETLVSFFIG